MFVEYTLYLLHKVNAFTCVCYYTMSVDPSLGNTSSPTMERYTRHSRLPVLQEVFLRIYQGIEGCRWNHIHQPDVKSWRLFAEECPIRGQSLSFAFLEVCQLTTF